MLSYSNFNRIEFWKEFLPYFHICDTDYLHCDPLYFSNATLDEVKERMKHEGYLSIDPVNWGMDIEQLASGVKKLYNNNINPIYVTIYDEYWLLFQKLHSLISSIIGNYKHRLRIWVWYIDPTKEQHGFSIHREYQLVDTIGELPKSISLWIPLTDATTLNSCMFVVPANRDPKYLKQTAKEYTFKYEDIRALPIKAGGILGWNHSILHWGSRSSNRSNQPRISISAEFQSLDSDFVDRFHSSYDANLTFNQRLNIIELNKIEFGQR
jgi:hypothetical protein